MLLVTHRIKVLLDISFFTYIKCCANNDRRGYNDRCVRSQGEHGALSGNIL